MDSRKALEQALRALELDKNEVEDRARKLDEQIASLRSMLPRPGRPKGSGPRRKRRGSSKRKPMTAAQKKQISAAMKKAWARRKRAK